MKILIAEDDAKIAKSLARNFQAEGYPTSIANNGKEALDIFEKEDIELILLDWRMPEKSGIEVCREIRAKGHTTPIILLTALTDVSNKVEALDLGADDYITKPFSFVEVMARIKAITRRAGQSKSNIPFEENSLNLLTRELQGPDNSTKLAEMEFELLKYFLENRNSILNRDMISESVWNMEFSPLSNYIDVTTKNLRKKLEECCGKKYIETVYGEGYSFISD